MLDTEYVMLERYKNIFIAHGTQCDANTDWAIY